MAALGPGKTRAVIEVVPDTGADTAVSGMDVPRALNLTEDGLPYREKLKCTNRTNMLSLGATDASIQRGGHQVDYTDHLLP